MKNLKDWRGGLRKKNPIHGRDFVKMHIRIYAIQDIKGCGILRPPPPPYDIARHDNNIRLELLRHLSCLSPLGVKYLKTAGNSD